MAKNEQDIREETLKKLNLLRPTLPTVYVQACDTSTDHAIYTLHCSKMDWMIECFMETATVNMSANWLNKQNISVNCLFMIPIRGSVTDCTVYIGNERVRTTNIVNINNEQLYNVEQVRKYK